MGSLQVRWSEHEARKTYARPFGVTFLDDSGTDIGGVAVSGAALLYYREFQGAVLALAGELFCHAAAEQSADVQRAWLEVVAGLLPPLALQRLHAESSFDDVRGRLFHVVPDIDGAPWVVIEPAQFFEYQDFQAALAHQTGRLYRRADVEAIDDPGQRQRTWLRVASEMLVRDSEAAAWPFGAVGAPSMERR